MSKVDYSVNWDTLSTHLKERQRELYNESHFADVTLVSDDKKQFKAHKVVLSASSSVFKSIIGESLGSSPFIYLRGIQSHEIESVLQFIYLGQATCFQERMNEFLNVAKSLEIKEISKEEEK